MGLTYSNTAHQHAFRSWAQRCREASSAVNFPQVMFKFAHPSASEMAFGGCRCASSTSGYSLQSVLRIALFPQVGVAWFFARRRNS